MRKLLLLIFLLPVFQLNAQSWKWAKSFPYPAGYSSISNVEFDNQNNIYFSGSFSSGLKLKNTYTGSGQFLVKSDTLGNILWEKIYKYAQSHATITDMAGNTYFVVSFASGTSIDNQNILNAGDYLIKFDKDGNYKFHKSFTGVNFFNSIAVNGNKVSFLFSSTKDVKFESATIPGSSYSYVVIQTDTAGNYQWGHRLNYNSSISVSDICQHTDGSVAVAGSISGPFSVNGKSYSPLGNTDALVVKLQNGMPSWVGLYGDYGSDNCDAIVVNSKGDYIISGFENQNGFNTSMGASKVLGKIRGTDGYLVMPRQVGEYGTSLPNGLKVDKNDNVYIAASFSGNWLQIWSADSILNIYSTGKNDAFVVKLNQDLTPMWSLTVTNSRDQYATSLALDKNNNIVMAGYFADSASAGMIKLKETGGSLFLTKSFPDSRPAIPSDLQWSAQTNVDFTKELKCMDKDGDNLSFRLKNLPVNFSYLKTTASTLTITGKATNSQIGDYRVVVFVNDGYFEDSLVATLRITVDGPDFTAPKIVEAKPALFGGKITNPSMPFVFKFDEPVNTESFIISVRELQYEKIWNESQTEVSVYFLNLPDKQTLGGHISANDKVGNNTMSDFYFLTDFLITGTIDYLNSENSIQKITYYNLQGIEIKETSAAIIIKETVYKNGKTERHLVFMPE